MATDFSYNGKTINSSGPIKPSGKNQPLDPRTEVKLYADIESIPSPYIGMIITVLEDETNSNKMTDYKVLSLKANASGIANSVVDQVQRYVDYLGVATGGGTGEGLTSEQAQQLADAYSHSQSAHLQVGDIKTSQIINDSSFVTTTQMNVAINNAQFGEGATLELYPSLQGKKWACIGDSITEVNSTTTKHYHDYIADITGLTVVNLGYSGTGYTKTFNGKTYFSGRLSEIPSDSDIITILGGINDCGGNGATTTLGTIDDTTVSTFYGGVNLAISNLISSFPDKAIGIISFLPSTKSTSDHRDRITALEEVCKKYHVPFLNLYDNSGFFINNTTWINNYLPDGLHPNALGHKKISNIILDFINKISLITEVSTELITLSSINATYTQGSTIVYPSTSLENLKNNLVVIATYSDGSTKTITSYSLSGTLSVGTSTITVTYSEKTTTFNVTVSEEPSETITYTVTNNLTNVVNSNSATTLAEGVSYSATLTPISGYELSAVTVTMGGTDITSSVYSNGVISISSVSGNIVITASAEITAASGYLSLYDNLTTGEKLEVSDDGTTEKITSSSIYSYTDYIEVVPGSTLVFNKYRWNIFSAYDENKVFIEHYMVSKESTTEGEFVLSSNAKYIRVNIYSNWGETMTVRYK